MMKIEIEDFYDDNFVKSLPRYILKKVDENGLSYSRCKNIETEFNINVVNLIIYAIKTLSVRHFKDHYIIEVNKNIKYNNISIKKLIDTITYGNRTTKGYRIIPELFEFVSNNIETIYREWQLNGY